MSNDTWDLRELRTNVGQRYGEKQELELWEILQSIFFRLKHARFHIEEFERLEDEVVSGRSSIEIAKEIFRFHETRISEISVKATAHALGAVQALHSLSDILGSAIMLSLNNGVSWKGYFHDIKLSAPHLSLAPLIDELNGNASFIYLADLTNRSKHRTVVQPRFQADLTGGERNRYDFVAFEHKGRVYGPKEVKTFLINEYDRQGIAIFRIGNELNRLTR
ncbi:hypothetical protein ACFFJK_16435 [Massilia consociata]|uniref:Uncharacterized protein n=1 Tax=Massilia consociata TaxID=760117 RepID=A0ABV6FIY3_9BURK